jgi:hypothetical protein
MTKQGRTDDPYPVSDRYAGRCFYSALGVAGDSRAHRAGLLSRKKFGHPDEASVAVKEIPPSRFLGTQIDIAILIFGLLSLLAVIGWVRKTFFG